MIPPFRDSFTLQFGKRAEKIGGGDDADERTAFIHYRHPADLPLRQQARRIPGRGAKTRVVPDLALELIMDT